MHNPITFHDCITYDFIRSSVVEPSWAVEHQSPHLCFQIRTTLGNRENEKNKGLHPDSTNTAVSNMQALNRWHHWVSFYDRQEETRITTGEKNSVYSSIILTLPFLSEAQRRQDIVNIMLLLLITLLYCLIFFFVIPENISTFLTLIALVLLTIYRLSAIFQLTCSL